MLVIADAKKPVALAGVMGGSNSQVTPATQNILLESALFLPGSVRKTARSLSISTDSSYRFERGVDPQGLERALNRCRGIDFGNRRRHAGLRGLFPSCPSPLSPPRSNSVPERCQHACDPSAPLFRTTIK